MKKNRENFYNGIKQTIGTERFVIANHNWALKVFPNKNVSQISKIEWINIFYSR